MSGYRVARNHSADAIAPQNAAMSRPHPAALRSRLSATPIRNNATTAKPPVAQASASLARERQADHAQRKRGHEDARDDVQDSPIGQVPRMIGAPDVMTGAKARRADHSMSAFDATGRFWFKHRPNILAQIACAGACNA